MIFADRSQNCGPSRKAETRMNIGLPKRIRTSDPQLRRLIQESSNDAPLRSVLGPQLRKHTYPQTQCLRGVDIFCGPKLGRFYLEDGMMEQITHEMAAQALDSLDDCARMNVSMDAIGPRGVLERYIAQQAASAAPAQEPVDLPDLLPPMNIRTDRDMLNYLHQAFENEMSVCPRCHHSEPTKDTDSATFLRDYLAAAPVASAAPVVPEAARIAELERENAELLKLLAECLEPLQFANGESSPVNYWGELEERVESAAKQAKG